MNRVNATAIGLLLTALAITAVSCWQQARAQAHLTTIEGLVGRMPSLVESHDSNPYCHCHPCECCKGKCK